MLQILYFWLLVFHTHKSPNGTITVLDVFEYVLLSVLIRYIGLLDLGLTDQIATDQIELTSLSGDRVS